MRKWWERFRAYWTLNGWWRLPISIVILWPFSAVIVTLYMSLLIVGRACYMGHRWIDDSMDAGGWMHRVFVFIGGGKVPSREGPEPKSWGTYE